MNSYKNNKHQNHENEEKKTYYNSPINAQERSRIDKFKELLTFREDIGDDES